MVTVRIFRNKQGDIIRFQLSGHAGFAPAGEDIVCAAVSMLVINTINSIEEFTKDKIHCQAEESGWIEAWFEMGKNEKVSHDAALLLKAMVKGLYEVKKEYGSYISINDEEVQ